MAELKPCPFCGSKIKIICCDGEGNSRNAAYEKEPWSGLGYRLYHVIDDDPKERCPIAKHGGEGEMGIFIYDTKQEAIEAWNTRAKESERECQQMH